MTKLGYELVFTAPAEAFWVQMKVGLIAGIFIARARHPVAGVGLRRARPAHAREEVRAAVRDHRLAAVLDRRRLLALRGDALRDLSSCSSYSRPGLKPMITIENHIDFLLKFTLAFGAVFELPLLITLASRMGLVTAQDAGQEPQVRHPGRLHHRRGSDADPGRLQPGADGGTADHPLRGRHHLRSHLRPPGDPGRRAGAFGDSSGFQRPRSARSGPRRDSRGRLRDDHPDPGGRAAAGPQGQGRGRPVADRHRQDGGVPDLRLHAPAARAGPAAIRADGPARADHRADPRAGGADRVRRAPARPLHAVQHPGRVRRHRLRQAARDTGRRLRPPRRHARAG